jgi:hypothetical protein
LAEGTAHHDAVAAATTRSRDRRGAVRGAPARTRRCDNDARAPAGGRIGKSPHAIDARCGIPHRALDSTINDQARW